MELNMQQKSTYIYPLLVNGERILLNKDPFVYAEEGAYRHWSEKVDKLANELAFQNLYELGKEIPYSRLKYEAARILAPHFLADEHFLDYFKLDGGDYMYEYGEYNYEEGKWKNQIGLEPKNKELCTEVEKELETELSF